MQLSGGTAGEQLHSNIESTPRAKKGSQLWGGTFPVLFFAVPQFQVVEKLSQQPLSKGQLCTSNDCILSWPALSLPAPQHAPALDTDEDVVMPQLRALSGMTVLLAGLGQCPIQIKKLETPLCLRVLLLLLGHLPGGCWEALRSLSLPYVRCTETLLGRAAYQSNK